MIESGESCAVAVLAEGAGAGFAVHQDVEGEAAQSGDDARVGSDPGSILGEGDVSDIVGGIFDAPVCADGLCDDGGGERGVGDVEGGIVCQLEQPGFGIACGDCALDLNDGGDMVDRLFQRRLIVLDLDDEADVACLGDVEGFFGNAGHRG